MSLRLAALVAALLSFPAFAQVAVTDAWVRATVAGQKGTGAFMQLKAATDATLVAVTSPVAKVVEIHEMKMDGGVMRMSAVDKLPLPAGKTVELKPSGYHVMLMDLAGPLSEGATVPLTLVFDGKDGRKEMQVNATVRNLAGGTIRH